jgi:Amt family ammonium transporter
MDTITTTYALNTFWVLFAAVLVFFMQTGFALVEAGCSRTKNTTNILF